VRPAVEYLTSRLGYHAGQIGFEINTPWGRPDIVACSSQGQRRGAEREQADLRLWALIEAEGPTRLSALSDRLGMTPRSVRGRISRLVKEGLLSADGDRLEALPGDEPATRICAVELKVRDHSKGLRQTLRYQTFADEVCLFLARSPSTLDPAPFSARGVGLVELLPEPRLLVRARPSTRQNVPYARRLVEHSMWSPVARRSCA
jgi:hypothetical protein